MPTTTNAVTMAPRTPRPLPPSLRPCVRMARTSTTVAMISVTRFCATFRISGPVEKMPSTGPALGADFSVIMPSSAGGASRISGSVRCAWNWP